MYEHLTPEYIKADILNDFELADTREGSYTNTLVSPVAYEMWKFYMALNAVIPMVYIDEKSGIYIDKKAAHYGIERKPGTKAQAVVEIAGDDGTLIIAGKVFLTGDSLQYALDTDVVITDGLAHCSLTAVENGEKYNVPAGAIFRQMQNQTGITRVESAAAIGGTDAESDTSLVNRYYDFLRRPPTSGNIAHYEKWAREIDGVGAAKVIPLWNGPGTVKVLIAGDHNQPVDAAIVESVTSHIEKVRPIGADVSVESASGHTINVAASVAILPTTDIYTVEEAFSAALTLYFESISFTQYLVVYNRIGYILLGIPGVVNYTDLTINGAAIDIPLSINEVPVIGAIEVAL